MKKILVTGGAGLIGLEICKQLIQQEHEVHLFDLGEQIQRMKEVLPSQAKVFYGSINDTSSLRAAMADCELVIHLAALLGVKRTEADKLRCIEINIEGTRNVLECAAQHDVKKVVFASSSEVYGEPLKNPITEEDITQGKTVYAVTKMAGEELCKAYHQRYGINYSIVRYFNCYGPYQTAQFVISKFIYNVMNDLPLSIHGDGQQVRSYTYVSDTAEATILAGLNDAANGEVINIGSDGEPISLNELAKMIVHIGGKEGQVAIEHQTEFVNCDRSKDREIFERFCDVSKAKQLLSWTPKVSLEQGIRQTFESGMIFPRWEHLHDVQN